MRALVVDDNGTILRTVSYLPEFFHIQAGPGEHIFALTDGDQGQLINDSTVRVSEEGELIGPDAPEITLQYVHSG